MQVELEQLVSEETQLRRTLSNFAKRQTPIKCVSNDARSTLASWQDLGEPLEAATPDERLASPSHPSQGPRRFTFVEFVRRHECLAD